MTQAIATTCEKKAAAGSVLVTRTEASWCGRNQVLGVSPNEVGEINTPPHCIPDGELNVLIGHHQTQLDDWIVNNVPAGSLAKKLRYWIHQLWSRFIPPIWEGKPTFEPEVLIRFAWQSPQILGHYQPGRNDTGLLYEIGINPANVHQLSEMEVAAVLLHELLHLVEDQSKTAPTSPNGYHSAALRRTCDEIGIPCTKFGHAAGIKLDSPFASWAADAGLQGIALSAEPIVRRKKRPPRRVPWSCKCPMTALFPAGADVRARCEKCNAFFEPKLPCVKPKS